RMLRDPLLHNVRLVGALPEERVREVMAAGDILLLPSEREGIAIVLLEAMAMGVAPVAADVGGQRELATPDCGVLIPQSGNEERVYVAALISLLTDPDRRAQMGANARRRIIDHFRLEQMGERMDALIRAALHLHTTAPRAGPSSDAAQRSAISVIRQARRDRNVARLWQQIEEPPFPHSGARRLALALIRRARCTFRPLYRRLVGHDAHPVRRGVLAVRDLATRWIYGE
ncbi:glycosyltransferase family 4 protein, partial [Roseiflexus sp.]|uniref:glycosyltransferase family 4 protein n=1 Tax=Roseiflexus sp. TaxID=2562120 RepID=UPI00398B5AD7